MVIGLILVVIANVSPCDAPKQHIVAGDQAAICDALDRHGKHEGKHRPRRD